MKKKLRNEDYSLLRDKVNKLLLLNKETRRDKYLLRARVTMNFLKEYYSIKSLLIKDFRGNAELLKCIKYMPKCVWVLYSIAFEITCLMIVILALFIYFLFFRFNCLISFGVPISIAIVYFYNEFAKVIQHDMYSSIFNIQEIVMKK